MKYRIIKLSGYEKYKVQVLRTVGFFKKREKWIDARISYFLDPSCSFVFEYDSIEAAQREIDEQEEAIAIETGNWEPIVEK